MSVFILWQTRRIVILLCGKPILGLDLSARVVDRSGAGIFRLFAYMTSHGLPFCNFDNDQMWCDNAEAVVIQDIVSF